MGSYEDNLGRMMTEGLGMACSLKVVGMVSADIMPLIKSLNAL